LVTTHTINAIVTGALTRNATRNAIACAGAAHTITTASATSGAFLSWIFAFGDGRTHTIGPCTEATHARLARTVAGGITTQAIAAKTTGTFEIITTGNSRGLVEARSQAITGGGAFAIVVYICPLRNRRTHAIGIGCQARRTCLAALVASTLATIAINTMAASTGVDARTQVTLLPLF